MGHVDIQDKCSHGRSWYVGEVGIGSVFVEWAIWDEWVSGLSFQVAIGNKWV